MRWRDGDGARMRLRQQRLAWRRWVKPEAATDLLPGGLGDDPISLIIGLPGLLVAAVKQSAHRRVAAGLSRF